MRVRLRRAPLRPKRFSIPWNVPAGGEAVTKHREHTAYGFVLADGERLDGVLSTVERERAAHQARLRGPLPRQDWTAKRPHNKFTA
jgi:hypothetical protein